MENGIEPTPPFEADLRRLERIVDDLERGEPALSEALAKYEQGVTLLARCHGVLDQAERSVALLTGVDDAGNPVSTPFDAAATLAPEPSPVPLKPAPSSAPRRNRRTAPPKDGDDSLIPF